MLPEIQPTSIIGRFQIQRKLGEGAFGRVFLAFDPNVHNDVHRLVAVKLPHPHVFQDMAMQMRFLRELQTISSLRPHVGVCRFIETGMYQRSLFVVMEYVEGESLANRLERIPNRPLLWVLKLIRDIALIMADVHEQQVVHRDLKPSNIMLRRHGDADQPVIMDFGLARGDRSQELRLTRTGQVLGTPYYMAPEIISGNAAHAGPAADIYSLGVMLFEMLTGRRPFDGPTIQLFEKVSKQPAPPPSLTLSTLPCELDHVCLSALAKDPAQRFGESMTKFSAALDELVKQAQWAHLSVGSTILDGSESAPTMIQPPGWSPSTQAEQRSKD